MVAETGQEKLGLQAGDEVEIVRKKAFDEGFFVNRVRMPPGRYTEKIVHLKSKLSTFITMLFLDPATDIIAYQ